jgi:dGTPase
LEELGSVTSAACLAHDMGNPPFGHSGEKAISQFFKSSEGSQYKQIVDNPDIWNDFTNFEGNANAFRLLTHQFAGRRSGGFALTYSTVASIVKYPYPSSITGKKKYGFFQSEKAIFYEITQKLGMKEKSGQAGVFDRHPISLLVEAADDICYQIMDIEDAHKLRILSTEETKDLLLGFFDKNIIEDKLIIEKIEKVCKHVTDTNEQISYLRANIIRRLVDLCTKIFCENYDRIMEG